MGEVSWEVRWQRVDSCFALVVLAAEKCGYFDALWGFAVDETNAVVGKKGKECGEMKRAAGVICCMLYFVYIFETQRFSKEKPETRAQQL